LTYSNFNAAIPFANYSAENWEALVRDGISTNSTSFNKVEMRMLRNAHIGTSHVLKSYIDQVLNGALSSAYNRIAALEVQVTYLWKELTRMHLYDWLSQIALYCLASGITLNSQKTMCALTCLRIPASTYMKSYFDKVQTRLDVGSWGDFV